MGNLVGRDRFDHEAKENSESKTDDWSSIVLMGDSVLDNFYWLDDKTMDIEHQLKSSLRDDNISIYNFAVDESLTIDILNGKKPSIQYINGRRENNLDPYPISSLNTDNDEHKVYPFKLLKELLTCTKPIIVLSIGGNDVRVNLGYNHSEQVIAAIKRKNFQQNYHEIVNKIVREYQCNLILILCYQPNLDSDGTFYNLDRRNLIEILKYVANIIFDIGKEYQLPIIDLSRTFDPFNGAHYGSTPIEPSNLSGQFIVDLIIEIKKKFNFGKDQSKIYYGYKESRKGIKVSKNNSKAWKQYLNDLKNQRSEIQHLRYAL